MDFHTNNKELETRLEHLEALNKSLEECYGELIQKAESMPELRKKLSEQMVTMTADLKKLSPELQEQIQKGNINFFVEYPDKAIEAKDTLEMFSTFSVLLKEVSSIPRDVDRLISKGKQLRKDLEEEWEYFRIHKRKILQAHPDFKFPENPSQLLVKEPKIDLNPKDQGPSPLLKRHIGVFKPPPK